MNQSRALALAALGSAVALAGAAAAGAVLAPGRTLTLPAPVVALAQTGRTVAFAVGETPRECAHVELWVTSSRARYRLGRPTRLPCKEGPSTGSGVADVALASTRVLWVAYAGGNVRDWQLFTATPTRRAPRLLHLVSRDVDAPAPIVVGPGTSEGVPYAVDRRVTYLGDDGARRFTTTVAAPVAALAAGNGPGGRRVAALLRDGTVLTLSASGAVVDVLELPVSEVQALRLAPAGVVLERASSVDVLRGSAVVRTASFPRAAAMLDYAEGRVLYRLGRELRVLRLATRGDGSVAVAPRGTRPLGQTEPQGASWAVGTRLSWRGGAVALP